MNGRLASGLSLCLLGIACQQHPAPSEQTGPAAANSAPGSAEATPPDKPLMAEKPAAKPTSTDGPQSAAADVFTRRILPILQSPKPSSCTECHLSGVDLKDYLRESPEESFSALVQAGLIDTANPDRSKILDFIRREPATPGLIPREIRQQELDAFQEWIRTAVQDPQFTRIRTQATVGPRVSDEVIRHARTDRVLTSFLENVWNEVGRCASCHSPDRNAKQVKEHGPQVSWIQLNNPQATLDHLRTAGLIDLTNPTESLLLKKPLQQVPHGGGQKMVIGDRTYQQFRRFLDDYAAVHAGRYKSADDLPPTSDELSRVTDIWLKLTDVPARFDQQLLQVDLYRWTGTGWSEARVATSDRPVFGARNLWQHSLSLTAPRDSDAARTLASEKLPPGRYLIRILVDQSNRLAADPLTPLGRESEVASVEVQSNWPAGYGKMTVVAFPQ